MMYSAEIASPLGSLTLASDGEHLTGLWIEGQKYHGHTLFNEMTENPDLPVFRQTQQWLSRYFAKKCPDLHEIPLAPAGSDFRQQVWNILCQIPYGQVITYGDIAKQMAILRKKPGMSGQAVGGAVGHNPISIIIPCHRVVGTSGSLTGYAGGLQVKQRLLQLEGVDTSGLFVPKRGTAL